METNSMGAIHVNIAVVMTTYFPENDTGQRRFENAKRVIASLEKNLHGTPFTIVVSDDSPTELGRLHSQELLGEVKVRTLSCIGPNLGVGASINRALGLLDKWYSDNYSWIYLPDDFELTKPLHLFKAIRLIEDFGYDFVRLDLPHPELVCTTKFCQGVGWWLEVDLSRDYAFATRPTLISRHLTDVIGPFFEQEDAYRVEVAASRMVINYRDTLKGAIVPQSFGDSWEHLSLDKDEVGLIKAWQQ